MHSDDPDTSRANTQEAHVPMYRRNRQEQGLGLPLLLPLELNRRGYARMNQIHRTQVASFDRRL